MCDSIALRWPITQETSDELFKLTELEERGSVAITNLCFQLLVAFAPQDRIS